MRNHPIIVQKYGGACLETPAKIRAVASDLADLHGRGHRVVAIVSAMGRTTDQLIGMAYQVSPHPNRRELDMLLTTGERISMALMSMALSDLGVPAISFTGSQAGVMTDDSHSAARILDVRPVRVREELDRGRIVVLAGFQGVNPVTKEITTLGRGGSDTTAVAMAAALQAERCEIIKEVDGVCSADPRIVPYARPLRRLDFAALSEMCFWGAKVLHFRSVELAQSQDVSLVLKQWGGTAHSTQVMKEVAGMESGKVLAVNSMARIEHVEIDSTDLNHGFEKFAQHLKQNSLSWPQLLASRFAGGKTSLSLACDSEWLDALLRTLERSKDLRQQREASSSVSLTCFGGVSSELPFRALQVLGHHGIVPDMYVLSPHSVSLFVPVENREAAVKALHSLVQQT
jgi:aspartate kinase